MISSAMESFFELEAESGCYSEEAVLDWVVGTTRSCAGTRKFPVLDERVASKVAVSEGASFL